MAVMDVRMCCKELEILVPEEEEEKEEVKQFWKHLETC